MRRRRIKRMAIAVGCGLMGVILIARWLAVPSPEERIRAAVAQFEEGLERGSAVAALRIVSKRFHGQDLTYSDVSRGLWELCRNSRGVHLSIDRLVVDVARDRRSAQVTAHITFYGSGSMGDFAFGLDEPVLVGATFEREGRAWRAVDCFGWPTVPSAWY